MFSDPISTKTCNAKNYWTFYNQDTTCFRFMDLNNNDNTTNTTIKLLSDHDDLGVDTFANYNTILNNNTAKETPFEIIRNTLSFFMILLGITYIVRKKTIFEK